MLLELSDKPYRFNGKEALFGTGLSYKDVASVPILINGRAPSYLDLSQQPLPTGIRPERRNVDTTFRADVVL